MGRTITLRSNVDIGLIPPTPETQYFDNSSLLPVARILKDIASEYGSPISFIQEHRGELVQNIIPIHKTQNQQVSTSSKIELGLHTETAFHPYRPSTVLLLCLRGDPAATTTYADIDEISKLIDPDTLSTLTHPWFTTSIDDSFRTNGEKDMEFVCSILKQITNDSIKVDPVYEITYDEVLMKGINEQATDALGTLKEAIGRCTREVVLRDGDLLIIDNKATVHGRRPFNARYDGTDRWVQRMLVLETMPPENQIDGHMITTLF